jgi:phage-related protein
MKGIVREVFYFKRYYLDFFETLDWQTQKKFNWTLELITTVERVPEKFFKFIVGSDGIYEIRVEVGNDIYRVFAFFDKGHLIILANGFNKKSQKTPRNEIEKAQRIKTEYFYEKDNEK